MDKKTNDTNERRTNLLFLIDVESLHKSLPQKYDLVNDISPKLPVTDVHPFSSLHSVFEQPLVTFLSGKP
jgi:hypothetical protein